MSDLSNLLGDVYGEADPDGPPVVHEPPALERVAATPEWADDRALDDAFEAWTPGPPADAPAVEHEMAAVAPAPAGERLDDDLARALSAALADAPPAAPPAPAVDTVPPMTLTAPVAPVAVAAPADVLAEGGDPFAGAESASAPRPWRREDDDILPAAARRRRR